MAKTVIFTTVFNILTFLTSLNVFAGHGVQPELNWDRHAQQLTVACDDLDTARVYLVNASSGPAGADIRVTGISVLGQSSSDFSIISSAMGSEPPWLLTRNDSVWLDIQFHPDLSMGFASRKAIVVAMGDDQAGANYEDTLVLTGIINDSKLVAPSSVDFGNGNLGDSSQMPVTILDTGNTPIVLTSIELTGQHFSLLNAPHAGNTLWPGESDTFQVQFNHDAYDSSVGTIMINTDHPACSNTTIMLRGNTVLQNSVASRAAPSSELHISYDAKGAVLATSSIDIVRVEVWNLRGILIALASPQSKSWTWDGLASDGSITADGVYLLKVTECNTNSDAMILSKKVLLAH